MPYRRMPRHPHPRWKLSGNNCASGRIFGHSTPRELAEALVGALRQQRIIVPAIDVIERVCGEALTSGTKKVYGLLTSSLTDHHRCRLNDLLLPRDGSKYSVLVWLRQASGPPKPRHILTHLERLKTIEGLQLPDGLGQTLHQNRLLKLAREGGQMSTQHLRDVKMTRSHATLVAMSIDIRATN